jgi:hypothetical protein
MSLKHRGMNVYCYRSVRRDGRAGREYVGSGPYAVLMHAEAGNARADRRALRRAADRFVSGLKAVTRLVARVSARVGKSFAAAMTYCGWRAHKREWRRRKTVSTPDHDRWARRERAFEEGRQAEKARRLFDAVDDVPALIEKLGGGLGKRARERLVERMADDPELREAIRRESDALRRELEGEKPTVIERLVVERFVVAWLAVGWMDLHFGGFAGDLTSRELAAHIARMRKAANRDYLFSLRALDLIQRAAPAVTVNVDNTVKVNVKGRGKKKGIVAGGRLAGLGAVVNRQASSPAELKTLARNRTPARFT